MEEIKKTKELNASFNNKLLVSNLNDINSTKQRLTQSKIELQRNVNEASKVKSATVQVSVCCCLVVFRSQFE